MYFNPRTHEECDLWADAGAIWSGIFQSTHSRGVRRLDKGLQDQFETVFQSTHSRGVRPEIKTAIQPNVDISIHALTRSATTLFVNVFMAFLFQSTHSRGVRLLNAADQTRPCNFNPRTHEECDCITINEILLCSNFNPRTHEECDVTSAVSRSSVFKFQSTHSRGVRPRIIAIINEFMYNSTD